jgi:hypothetical protein
MRKPSADLLKDIVDAAALELTKTASPLSEEIQSPSISTELGAALMSAATSIKQASQDNITAADVASFMEKLKHV